MKFKKKAWEKLGGLNEQFKNGGEDQDVGLRALKAGMSVGYIDRPMVHKHSQSAGRKDNTEHNVKLLDKLWPNEKIVRLLKHIAVAKAKTTPVLYTTYNRLAYTKKTLPVLLKSACGEVIVIDNASTDGTQKWLKRQKGITLILNKKNLYVAGAMNQFFELTKYKEFIAKVDNDTLVPKNWLVKLLEHSILHKVDIIQAKHPLIVHDHKEGFDDWVKNFPKKGTLRINEFVGGSGIIIRRLVIKEKLNTTLGILRGWTEWQRRNPKVVKGFDISVEIKLLDTKTGKTLYDKYRDYYKFTERL